MYFADGVSEPLAFLFETHPLLVERIRAFEPNFDGKFPYVRYGKGESMNEAEPPSVRRQTLPRHFPNAGGWADRRGRSQLGVPTDQSPHAILPNVGKPMLLHLEYANKLRDALPDDLTNTAREPLAAAALIYALLLSPDENIRTAQIEGIGKNFSTDVADKTAALYPQVSAIATHVRLPIVNLALGALKQLTPAQFSQFSATLQWLINSDGQVALFEFVLQKIVMRNLGPKFGESPRRTVQF